MKFTKHTLTIGAVGAMMALTLTSCGQTPSQGQAGEASSYPGGKFTMMVPGDAGGGWDGTGRALVRAIDENDLAPSTQVINQGGAGGTIGLASFVKSNDKNSLSITGSTMVGGILTSKSAVTFDDVEPAAVLALEYVVVAVPADSPYKTLADFLADLKKDPAGTPVAVGSTGGVDHLGFAMVAEKAGVDPTKINAVSFKDGGLTSVLNGDVKAGFSTLQQWAPQYESGDLRVLGVTSPERVEGLDAPTFMEQGIDVDWASWRGLVSVKDVTDQESAEIDAFLTKIHQSQTWQDALKSNNWADSFMVGEEADAYFDEQEKLYSELLPRLGLAE